MAWWVAVVAVLLGMLAIDLFFFHRQAHEVSRPRGWQLDGGLGGAEPGIRSGGGLST